MKRTLLLAAVGVLAACLIGVAADRLFGEGRDVLDDAVQRGGGHAPELVRREFEIGRVGHRERDYSSEVLG